MDLCERDVTRVFLKTNSCKPALAALLSRLILTEAP